MARGPEDFLWNGLAKIAHSKESVIKQGIGAHLCRSRQESPARDRLRCLTKIRLIGGLESGDKLLFESDGKGTRVLPVRSKSAFSSIVALAIPSGRVTCFGSSVVDAGPRRSARNSLLQHVRSLSPLHPYLMEP